jgi:hypothetical protein
MSTPRYITVLKETTSMPNKGDFMYHPYEDYHDFNYTTESEWDRAQAYDIGARHPELAWVVTGRDIWHPNPFYVGPPVPHLEDSYYDWADDLDLDGVEGMEDMGLEFDIDDESPF